MAFELPEEILDPILTFGELLQERAVSEGIKARWVSAEQCHLTMRFFGELTPKECALVHDVVDDVLAGGGWEPIATDVEEIGAFPDWQRPRVVWVGLQERKGRLQGIFHQLDDAFADAGLGRHDKQRFTPHITLARLKYAPGLAVKRTFGDEVRQRSFGVCELTWLTLFASELTPRGAIYRPLQRWELT